MTVKERLYHLIDTLPDSEAHLVERMLQGLHAPAQERTSAEAPFHTRLREMGIEFTPASPDAKMPQPLNLPGVDLSGAVIEEREEQLRRWD